MSTEAQSTPASPRCGHHGTELRVPDVDAAGTAHSPTGTFCPTCFPELFTASPPGNGHWESLLDRDKSQAWESLPTAPDLVPQRASSDDPVTGWVGATERECGDHRTTGARAWCFECTEWCYPEIPCRGCKLPELRRRLLAYERVVLAAREVKRTWEAYEGFDYSQPGAEGWQEDAAHAVFISMVQKLCTTLAAPTDRYQIEDVTPEQIEHSLDAVLARLTGPEQPPAPSRPVPGTCDVMFHSQVDNFPHQKRDDCINWTPPTPAPGPIDHTTATAAWAAHSRWPYDPAPTGPEPEGPSA
jgi:hypothetical protein